MGCEAALQSSTTTCRRAKARGRYIIRGVMVMGRDQSAEDYLEAILVVQEEKGNVRAIDVVNELNVSKPSVSIAMKKLKGRELITIDSNSHIHFTDEGRNIAENVYNKHKLLTNALIAIGVNEEEAIKEACEIEHIISDETYECIKNFCKKMKK